MQSVLSRVTSSDVASDPFPHVVVKDALDDDLCEQLQSEFPRLDAVTGDGAGASNKRFGIPASTALEESAVSPLWREFVALHSSPPFLKEIIGLFGDEILRLYPSFEETVGDLDTLPAGRRKRDSFDTADVLLDAQISVNTPVVERPPRHVHRRGPRALQAQARRARLPAQRDLRQLRRARQDGEIRAQRVGDVRQLPGVAARRHGALAYRRPEVLRQLRRRGAPAPLFDIAAFQASWVDKLVAAPERARRRLGRAA
jgi:hypothetical protein